MAGILAGSIPRAVRDFRNDSLWGSGQRLAWLGALVAVATGIVSGSVGWFLKGFLAGLADAILTPISLAVLGAIVLWSSARLGAPFGIGSAVNPPVLLARDRRAAIAIAAITGLGVAVMIGIVFVATTATIWSGVIAGVVIGLVAGVRLTASWPSYGLARIWLALRRKLAMATYGLS